MSSKTSCSKECGPRGNIIPTVNEEQVDLTPKPHFSCFISTNASCDKPEASPEVEVVENSSGKSEEEADDTSSDKPKELEAENSSCDKPEAGPAEEEVEEIKARLQEDDDGKQNPKAIDLSSLFNIADAQSGDVDRVRIPAPIALNAPTPSVEKLIQGAKIRSQSKSPSTKSPRELLQSVTLPPATSQQVYKDHIN